MNILFTTYCNLNCPYCFARNKLFSLRGSKIQYISLSMLKLVINFIKRSRKTSVGILGGEPTLYPRFKKAIQMVLDSGLEIQLFSNGIIKKENVAFLNKIDRSMCEILININNPEFYSPHDWRIINYVLKTLQNRVSLGFNIHSTQVDMGFLLLLIKKYRLKKQIRLGMSLPVIGDDNKYLHLTDYRRITEKIIKFAKHCDKMDTVIIFDCGFRLCDFTEEECGRLAYFNSPLISHCRMPIDVGPDLTVWPCFVTSKLWNKKLTDFNNIKEIREFYINRIKQFKLLGTKNNCLKCKYLRRGQCSGGCLGHIFKQLNIKNLYNR